MVMSRCVYQPRMRTELFAMQFDWCRSATLKHTKQRNEYVRLNSNIKWQNPIISCVLASNFNRSVSPSPHTEQKIQKSLDEPLVFTLILIVASRIDCFHILSRYRHTFGRSIRHHNCHCNVDNRIMKQIRSRFIQFTPKCRPFPALSLSRPLRSVRLL